MRRPRPGLRRATAAAVATSAMAAALLCAGAGTAQATVDPGLGYDPVSDKGSLYNIAEAVGAHSSYQAGYTGKGVGVALIDTGVSPVPGLTSGNVVQGPDLSFDSQDPDFAHLDAYGHGTHMAGIIAGRDVAGTPRSYVNPAKFNGIAPDATLVNVKVGASDGSVDVTQIIAAIDWVVEHKADYNIRVISLSYGTDSRSPNSTDPLAFAVENAWKQGVVVVVSGGNDGRSELTLADPASDPYVLAVGAADTMGTASAVDDTVPDWSTRGSNTRHVDVVAPGVSVLGLKVPGGFADERNPQARVGTRFAKASGTSQAAAVVSGEVALLLQSNPKMTPDQVKRQVMSTASAFSSTDAKYRGNGTTNVRDAQTKPVNNSTQSTQFYGTGTGSIAASRGTSTVDDGYGALTGNVDIFGRPFDSAAWARATAAGNAWVGGSWMGVRLTGDSWSAGAWPVTTWAPANWNARMWRSADWDARMWRSAAWENTSWDARMWRDAAWSARMWRSADFASVGWE
jgi:serine protease AprX